MPKIVKNSNLVRAFKTANTGALAHRGVGCVQFDLRIELKPGLLTMTVSLPPGSRMDFVKMGRRPVATLLRVMFEASAKEAREAARQAGATHSKLAEAFKAGAVEVAVEPKPDSVKIEITAAGVDFQVAGTKELVNLVRAIFCETESEKEAAAWAFAA